MQRTYVVTGAASGIGAATTSYLREHGARVVTSDLHDADVIADLATTAGRTALVAGVARLTGRRIDAIIANAGGGPPETSVQLNFFGAVATRPIPQIHVCRVPDAGSHRRRAAPRGTADPSSEKPRKRSGALRSA